jgi:integrase/recombinase XerD
MIDHDGIDMSECKVQLFFNKQRVNKNTGKISLYLELKINGEIDFVPLKGLKWLAVYFDWTTRSLLPRVKDDSDIVTFNAIIERERSKYWAVIKKFLLEDRVFSLTDVYRAVNLYKSGNTFFPFMEQAIKDRQKTMVKADMIKGSTAIGHVDSLNWFKEFRKHQDIEIMHIDGDLLEKFANYLRTKMAEGSVWKRIQNIKSYLSYGFRNRISVNIDYTRFKISKPEPDPTWLEEDEIIRLLNLYYGNTKEPILLKPEIRRDLQAFLFASFTGLRISDLLRWNKAWIKNDHISFIPVKQRKSVKSPKPVIIPIIPIAKQFIDDLKAESFDLPDEQVYNRHLKDIAGKAGIDKNLTSHVARHTFASWLAIEGVSVMVISKLLGHKNINTTMVYIHIAEQYLATEIMKIQTRFSLRAVV